MPILNQCPERLVLVLLIPLPPLLLLDDTTQAESISLKLQPVSKFRYHNDKSSLGFQHWLLSQGFSVTFQELRSCHSTLEKQLCIILTTSGEKTSRSRVPQGSGIGISRRKEKKKPQSRKRERHFDPVALHIVFLSNLLENFPLAVGSFSSWSAVFQRLLCTRRDKELFITQNGEALAFRKGRRRLPSGLCVLAPPLLPGLLPFPVEGERPWWPLDYLGWKGNEI